MQLAHALERHDLGDDGADTALGYQLAGASHLPARAIAAADHADLVLHEPSRRDVGGDAGKRGEADEAPALAERLQT